MTNSQFCRGNILTHISSIWIHIGFMKRKRQIWLPKLTLRVVHNARGKIQRCMSPLNTIYGWKKGIFRKGLMHPWNIGYANALSIQNWVAFSMRTDGRLSFLVPFQHLSLIFLCCSPCLVICIFMIRGLYLAMNNSCNFWSKVNVKVKSFARQQFGATISIFLHHSKVYWSPLIQAILAPASRQDLRTRPKDCQTIDKL